jgi:hypothetical protein
MYGMPWIKVYDSVSVLANIQQLHTAIDEESDNYSLANQQPDQL